MATRDDGVQPLRSVQYLGYARRLRSGLTLDIGVTNRLYTRYFSADYASQFLEGYVGVIGRRVSARLFVSPDFDGRGGDSAYVEANGLIAQRGRLSLSGHVGLLAPPREPDRHTNPKELDWRLDATRTFDRLAVSLQWVGRGATHETRRWSTAVVLSANRSF